MGRVAAKKTHAPAKKTRLTGPDACMLMHTALRKACDSKITSSVYNMVHLVDIEPEEHDPWRFLGKLVADHLQKGEAPAAALKRAHAEFEDKFIDALIEFEKNRGGSLPSQPRMWMYAISCAMHCFSQRDWDGMASYLGEEE